MPTKKTNWEPSEKFKTIENYKVKIIQHRITLTKLRLSNHKLAKKGQYVRPYEKPEERICPICKKDIEDEIHFFTLCSAYQEKKKYFIWILKQRIQNISKQNGTRWCFSVVNKPSEQEQTSAKLIAKYVFDCYEKRRSLVL